MHTQNDPEMTVRELISYLNTLNPDTIVQCVKAEEWMYSRTASMVNLNYDLMDYTDLRGVPGLSDNNFGKSFLEIGADR